MPVQPTAQDIHRAIVERADAGEAFAVAVVLKAEGSTPGKAGAKILVSADGMLQGTLGGGLVEAQTRLRATEAIQTGRPCTFDFRFEGESVGDSSPICGGAMRVLIDPAAARHRAAYASAAACRERRERAVLLTSVRGGDTLEVDVAFLPDPAIASIAEFPGPEAIRETLGRQETRLFVSPEPDAMEVLVEPLLPSPVLLIVGGGHVGQALAAQAALVGFRVVVLDDRPEFTDPALFPEGVATRCAPMEDELARYPIDADTYIVIVTRGHQHDAEALAACLRSPAAYLGMIGSRRKVVLMRQGLLESGHATAEEFDRVHAPIGLDIGAVTVPEIAASIVAQLIAVRRRGNPRLVPESQPS